MSGRSLFRLSSAPTATASSSVRLRRDPDTFLIIVRAGGSGAFKDLPQDATVKVNGVTLKISYTGGDGNDVTLTAQPPAPTAARLAYFRATAAGTGQVALSWGTLVEVQTLGFQVERATANGLWERVSALLIPATGGAGRPQTYALADTTPAATAGASYRLVEVDSRGQRNVLGVAFVQPAAVAKIARTPEGVQLSLTGSPGASLVIETSTDVALGPWTEAGTLNLDDASRGVLSLSGDTAEPMRFYRWSER